ncbi:MAG: hypothetical protein RIM84_23610 [Alphaproteobacteria bacterium]
MAGARRGVVARLQRQVARLERAAPARAGRFCLAVDAVDEALGDGLASAALHEVVGASDGVGTGFAAWLAARRAGADGIVLWCGAWLPYPPGLRAFGLDPVRLVCVAGRRPEDRLWAMEEGLKSGRPAVVVARLDRLDLTASRRLQLAAEAGGVTAIALRPPQSRLAPTAAATRWLVAPAPSRPTEGYAGVGATRWRVDLQRCRGGRPRHWLMEWDDASSTVHLAAEVADRPLEPGLAAPEERATGKRAAIA